MSQILRRLSMYLIKRLVICIVTIFIGLTITFIISRLLPFNAAEQFVSRLVSQGAMLTGEEINALKMQLLDLYGLNRPLIEQYFMFLRNYLSGNMGPSFAIFPIPVSVLVASALPWSLVLLLTATIISWILGNLLGVWAAVTRRRAISASLEYIALGIQPIPFAVLGIGFIIFYALILRLPLTLGRYVAPEMPWWSMIFEMFRRASLPALVLVLFGWTGSFLSMKSLALKLKQEDFITYLVLKGAPENVINRVVFRNSAIPQYTALLLGISRTFLGSVLVEYLFNYPGIGLLLRDAIAGGDLNLMLGILFLSVVATAVATFLLDLTYPLIDPRIRYPGAE